MYLSGIACYKNTLFSDYMFFLQLPKLIRLSAVGLDDMSDSLVSILSNMKAFNLERCWNISNDGISKIVENNPELERLSVSSFDIDDTGNLCYFTLFIIGVFSMLLLVCWVE